MTTRLGRLLGLPAYLRRQWAVLGIIRQLKRRLPDQPDQSTLLRLISAWRSAWAADLGYLSAVALHASGARAPILECGTGLTTLVASLYSQHGVWSLENHRASYRRAKWMLRLSGLRKAHVSFAPLVDRGTFDWYRTEDVALPEAFDLVICDGPVGTTRGGRRGLLPIMAERLSSATVLLDDASRPGEGAALEAWRREYGVTVERPAGERYAVVRLEAPRQGPADAAG